MSFRNKGETGAFLSKEKWRDFASSILKIDRKRMSRKDKQNNKKGNELSRAKGMGHSIEAKAQ